MILVSVTSMNGTDILNDVEFQGNSQVFDVMNRIRDETGTHRRLQSLYYKRAGPLNQDAVLHPLVDGGNDDPPKLSLFLQVSSCITFDNDDDLRTAVGIWVEDENMEPEVVRDFWKNTLVPKKFEQGVATPDDYTVADNFWDGAIERVVVIEYDDDDDEYEEEHLGGFNEDELRTLRVKLESGGGHISTWGIGKGVTNMGALFEGATTFNDDLSDWDTSHVTRMVAMFSGATAFNQDLSKWDVSSVTDMSWMFSGATAFNQDLSGWNVSIGTNMRSMFDGAVAMLHVANRVPHWYRLTKRRRIEGGGGERKEHVALRRLKVRLNEDIRSYRRRLRAFRARTRRARAKTHLLE
jgi:surface protein